MGPVAWRPPFPGALRGEETVNPTRPIGSGISINRLSRATEASLLARLGMVTKPSSPCGDLCLDRGIRPSISIARSFARYPKRPHRPNTQARSSLGPTAQRPALPSFDRQVRPKDLAPSLRSHLINRISISVATALWAVRTRLAEARLQHAGFMRWLVTKEALRAKKTPTRP
jgi:hypothetical protein